MKNEDNPDLVEAVAAIELGTKLVKIFDDLKESEWALTLVEVTRANVEELLALQPEDSAFKQQAQEMIGELKSLRGLLKNVRYENAHIGSLLQEFQRAVHSVLQPDLPEAKGKVSLTPQVIHTLLNDFRKELTRIEGLLMQLSTFPGN